MRASECRAEEFSWEIFRLLLRITSQQWLVTNRPTDNDFDLLWYCLYPVLLSLLLNDTHTTQGALWWVSELKYRVSLGINVV